MSAGWNLSKWHEKKKPIYIKNDSEIILGTIFILGTHSTIIYTFYYDRKIQ